MLKRIFCFLMVLVFLLSFFTIGASAEKSPIDFETNGNGGKTDVGTWFVTYNSSANWISNFGSGYPIKFRPLLPDGSYGILDSANVEHIDFQLKQLADAKIDFILFDHTNGGLTEEVKYGWSDTGKTIDKNVQLTCERISKWNETHDWKIRYAMAVGVYEDIRKPNNYSIGEVAEKQAKAVYNNYYKNSVYGDDHYTLNGKPLIVLHHWGYNVLTCKNGFNSYKGDKTYSSKFTVRNGQMGEPGTYGWDNRNGHKLHDEVFVVSPGQAVHFPSGVTVDVYREQGQWYRTGWEILLNNKSPRIVMVASFNDYHENTGVFIADTSKCKSEYDEQWIDVNGKINATMYWDMTKEGINKLRVKNGDNIKGLDKSVSVDKYITVGEGVAKQPKKGAVKITNVSSSSDSSTTDNNSTVANNKSQNLQSNSNSIIVIIIITTVIILAATGVCGYFFVFKKKKEYLNGLPLAARFCVFSIIKSLPNCDNSQ